METFFVFDSLRNTWLQDDERTWGAFTSAQGFTDRQLATDIAEREAPGRDGVFVFGSTDEGLT